VRHPFCTRLYILSRQWTEDDPHSAFGTALRIRLPADWQRPGRGPFQIVVHYETTAKCTAAQWLTPRCACGAWPEAPVFVPSTADKIAQLGLRLRF